MIIQRQSKKLLTFKCVYINITLNYDNKNTNEILGGLKWQLQ